jgi:hypothetical protein
MMCSRKRRKGKQKGKGKGKGKREKGKGDPGSVLRCRQILLGSLCGGAIKPASCLQSDTRNGKA